MAKIVKKADAPEGSIEVVYAGGEFKVTGNGYKTDDPVALSVAESYGYFDIEYDTPDSEQAEADAKRQAETRVRVEKAEAQRAEKDPAEPAPKDSPSVQPQETTTEDKD